MLSTESSRVQFLLRIPTVLLPGFCFRHIGRIRTFMSHPRIQARQEPSVCLLQLPQHRRPTVLIPGSVQLLLKSDGTDGYVVALRTSLTATSRQCSLYADYGIANPGLNRSGPLGARVERASYSPVHTKDSRDLSMVASARSIPPD